MKYGSKPRNTLAGLLWGGIKAWIFGAALEELDIFQKKNFFLHSFVFYFFTPQM